ncbi:hypothetical protein MAL1_00126 [Bacteriophage DSS3_MAL1]|nr:hypothetical protein MAL1_00126 [Bacteriophage DSS3_MAL1]
MGWNISTMENTVSLTEEQAKEVAPKIIAAGLEYFWETEEDASVDECVVSVFGSWWGKDARTEWKPYFDSDAMEHMDWLTGSDTAMAALAAAGATGRILFGSLEGDNSGTFWGVEFASGHYRKLTGEVSWTPGTSHPG